MNEVKKLNEEELQVVKNIKREYDEIAFGLGDIAIRKSRLLESYKKLSERESEIFKQLTYKYGNGNINLETGEIVPSDANTKADPVPNS